MTFIPGMRLFAGLGVLLVALLAGGCATGPNANPKDPLEPWNRKVASFNDAVDKAVLKPVATAYQTATPSLVQKGVSNFFNNLTDVWSALNSLAQLKIGDAAENTMRFSFNTVFGFAGILDIASELGIKRHREDFGQTLGYWGVPAGPYLVLPLLGPSTVRDTAALPLDWKGDPLPYSDAIRERNSLYGLRIVDKRTQLLKASNLLEEAALDKYSFTRDAFLQRRQNEVYDGNPPE